MESQTVKRTETAKNEPWREKQGKGNINNIPENNKARTERFIDTLCDVMEKEGKKW